MDLHSRWPFVQEFLHPFCGGDRLAVLQLSVEAVPQGVDPISGVADVIGIYFTSVSVPEYTEEKVKGAAARVSITRPPSPVAGISSPVSRPVPRPLRVQDERARLPFTPAAQVGTALSSLALAAPTSQPSHPALWVSA